MNWGRGLNPQPCNSIPGTMLNPLRRYTAKNSWKLRRKKYYAAANLGTIGSFFNFFEEIFMRCWSKTGVIECGHQYDWLHGPSWPGERRVRGWVPPTLLATTHLFKYNWNKNASKNATLWMGPRSIPSPHTSPPLVSLTFVSHTSHTLHHWLSAAPDSLLSVTELSQSPLHVSGTVCLISSLPHLL